MMRNSRLIHVVEISSLVSSLGYRPPVILLGGRVLDCMLASASCWRRSESCVSIGILSTDWNLMEFILELCVESYLESYI